MPRGAGGQVALSRAVLVRALGEGLILEMWELKRGVVKSLPQVCGWSWWGQASPPPPRSAALSTVLSANPIRHHYTGLSQRVLARSRWDNPCERANT